MKVVVLGAGLMGKEVARDLIKTIKLGVCFRRYRCKSSTRVCRLAGLK